MMTLKFLGGHKLATPGFHKTYGVRFSSLGPTVIFLGLGLYSEFPIAI